MDSGDNPLFPTPARQRPLSSPHPKKVAITRARALTSRPSKTVLAPVIAEARRLIAQSRRLTAQARAATAARRKGEVD